MKLFRFKKFIVEGGNVFKDSRPTTGIKKAYIKSTLDHYFQELARIFPKKHIWDLQHFHPLGSVGKKDVSGDIDLAVDMPVILKDFSDKELELWGVDPSEFNANFDKVKKAAKTSTDEQLKAKAFLMAIAKIMDAESDILAVHLKKINTGNIFTSFPQFDRDQELDDMVQVDWMVGNLDWLKFSYHSETYSGAVKGLHRTQLMLAAFSAVGKTFNHVNGIKDKITGEIEASNPKEALDLLNSLYNFKITQAQLNDYFKLYDYLDKHLSDSAFNKIKDIYLKILDSTRADIPENLQEYWIQNKSRLGLTGKFLPDNSALKDKI